MRPVALLPDAFEISFAFLALEGKCFDCFELMGKTSDALADARALARRLLCESGVDA